MLLGVADICATFAMRGLQVFFETKTGFMISFCLVFIVSCIYYIAMNEVVFVAIGVLLMRFGITTAFGLSFYGNAEYFQTDMVSTAFGAGNTVARFSTIISPMVAEVFPQPIIFITLGTLVSTVSSFFLIKPTNMMGSMNERRKSMSSPHIENNLPDIVRDFGGESEFNNGMPEEEEKNTEADQEVSYQADFSKPTKEHITKKEKFMIMDGEEEEDEDEI